MRHKTPYKKRAKRLGCGAGSGHGKRVLAAFESGIQGKSGTRALPFAAFRRLPKRGFNRSAFKKVYAIVNLQTLAKLSDKEITPELLLAKNVIKEVHDGLKILGSGELKQAVTVKAHLFSGSAKTKIEAKGGQAILLEK